MKKLNRKGYLTVEIIIASVIAFAIAFFLMEITINLVDITDNEYVDTNFMTDKALIMKNIKKNIQEDMLEYEEINEIRCNSSNTECKIYFAYSGGPSEARKITIDNENRMILYTDLVEGDNKNTIYTKDIDSNYSNMTITGGREGNYVYFQIKGKNIFSDELYDINIIVYNG